MSSLQTREDQIRDLYSKPAVRTGDRYCAPWCGAGCTWAAFQKATADAAQLCAELGEGWTPDVSENLGWHYMVKRGVIEVSFSRSGYLCIIQSTPQFIGHGDTAMNAIQDAADKFNAVVAEIQNSLASTRNTLSNLRFLEESNAH